MGQPCGITQAYAAREMLGTGDVTQPRFIRPELPVLITRRALRRTHLFRPDKTMTETYAYLLAWASQKHSVRVIAVTLMSNHEHLIVQASNGRKLADFMRDLHRLVALTTKAYRKWDGAVWDHEAASVVSLRTPRALVEKIAYLMVNPVAAACVHKARLWPGLKTKPEQLGCTLTVARRPRHFVDAERSAWPESLALNLEMPDAFEFELDDLVDQVNAESARQEAEARQEVKAQGRTWIGVRKLARMSPFRRARSPEAEVGRNPTFAVGRGEPHAFLEAVAELRKFRNAYREALQRWRSGQRDTIFPAATLAMVSLHAVRVDST